jgi:hypothetical protein
VKNPRSAEDAPEAGELVGKPDREQRPAESEILRLQNFTFENETSPLGNAFN